MPSAATCADYPDVLASDAEELELAIRKIVDEDEAVDIARLVLILGWRKPVKS